MVRVKRGNVAVKSRHKYLHLAKGYVGANSRLSSLASEQVIQSFQFAYIGRRLKKRDFRKIWIYRINAATRGKNNHYSYFLGCIRKIQIFLNRKLLAYLAFLDLPSFHLIERKSRIYK
jgi:large subunit ribosomal protein L20